jgi:uncharacterized NAD(P)/FAD-binding protein YdhS
MDDRFSVAIVGAGASGLLTAIQLLSHRGPSSPRVFLIEQADVFGTGAAYSTDNPVHLLNTRAGNMSAFPDRPGHFVEWLNATGRAGPECVTRSCFTTRHVFGQYLRALLREMSTGCEAAGRFYLVPDQAVSCHYNDAGTFTVRLGVGKDLKVDAVAIATGNPAPLPPVIEGEDALTLPHYIGEPWANRGEIRTGDGTILLLGTGLTMVDFVVALKREGHRGPILALSRRGLLPRAHTDEPMVPPPEPPALTSKISTDLRLLRRAASSGVDWRDVVDAFRPKTMSYWQALPLREKRRFLRHARPWWDVHRHRLAPQVASELHAIMESGALKIERGSLTRMALSSANKDNPVTVTWNARRTAKEVTVEVNQVINCMGPGFDPRQSRSTLIRQMLSDGLASPDAMNLGLAVDESSRLIDSVGNVHGSLFAIGPVTRGTFWEVTAVPDIRVQAQGVARTIISLISRAAHPVVPVTLDRSVLTSHEGRTVVSLGG